MENQGLLGFSHLKILVLLTRILEYCDLTETEIPYNFLSLFDSTKDRFLSQMETPLHILTNSEPGMKMSERLILFHALIISHTDKSRIGLGESQLGEVVGRQAKVSLCDIYNTVSLRLKAESQVDTVDLLFVMATLDSLLGAVVIQDRGIELADSISKIDCLTLLQVSRLVQVLTSLQKAKGEGRGESQQVPILVKAILVQVVAWLKSQECPARLFS